MRSRRPHPHDLDLLRVDHVAVLARQDDPKAISLAGVRQSPGAGSAVPGERDLLIGGERSPVQRANSLAVRSHDLNRRVLVAVPNEESDLRLVLVAVSVRRELEFTRGTEDLQLELGRPGMDDHSRDDDRRNEQQCEQDRPDAGQGARSFPAMTTTSAAPPASSCVGRSISCTTFTPRSLATFCAARFWPLSYITTVWSYSWRLVPTSPTSNPLTLTVSATLAPRLGTEVPFSTATVTSCATTAPGFVVVSGPALLFKSLSEPKMPTSPRITEPSAIRPRTRGWPTRAGNRRRRGCGSKASRSVVICSSAGRSLVVVCDPGTGVVCRAAAGGATTVGSTTSSGGGSTPRISSSSASARSRSASLRARSSAG